MKVSSAIKQPNKRRSDSCDATAADDSVAAKRANTSAVRKLLPVTLLSGFLGAGKTTLLKRILQSKESHSKIAIIVNDMGAINLDAEEIKKHKLVQEQQEMVEMHNGCICCTLRGDLLRTVKELALEEKYDYLVIESTGISEPLPVAQTFVMDTNEDAEGEDGGEEEDDTTPDFEPLSKFATMDTLVTVVDAFNFASILGCVEKEADREKYFGSDDVEDTEESEESVVQLLMDQIEFASVILLNKTDLLSDGEKSVKSQIQAIEAVLRKLNPKATVIVPELPKFEKFDTSRVLNTGLFDMEEAQQSAGWIAELEKPYHTPETEEYGINSFVFRNNERPFHPERLARILQNFGTALVKEISGAEADKEVDAKDIFARVIRCKGELWLSNADCCPIDVHSVGRQLVLEPAGRPWMAKVVAEHPGGDAQSETPNEDDCEAWDAVDLSAEVLEDLKASEQWDDRFGDRRSELVFIGIALDKQKILAELESALLTIDECNVAEKDRKKVWAEDVQDSFFDGMSLWNLSDILGVDEEDACAISADE